MLTPSSEPTLVPTDNATFKLLQGLPLALEHEQIATLLACEQVRIERILSHGQCSPADFWYDQAEHEWLVLLQGQARLQLADGRLVALNVGDSYFIPAHGRHRVDWTDPQQITVWLAIFIGGQA